MALYSSNYATLQHAVNAAVAANEILVVNADYTITSTITATLTNGKGLQLDGLDSKISGNFAGPLIRITVTGEKDCVLNIDSLQLANSHYDGQGILLRGYQYGGPLAWANLSNIRCTHGALADYLICLENFRHVNISSCVGKADGARGASLMILSNNGTFAGDCNVIHSEFAGGQSLGPIHISASGTYSQARGVHFTDCYPYFAGSLVKATSHGMVGDIYMQGVQFDQTLDSRPMLQVETDATGHVDNVSLTNCYFQHAAGSSIVGVGSGGLITNFTVSDTQIGGTMDAHAAVNLWQVHEVTLSGVQFEEIDSEHSIIQYNQGSLTNGEITVIGCSQPAVKSGSCSRWLWVHSASAAVVTGNRFKGKDSLITSAHRIKIGNVEG